MIYFLDVVSGQVYLINNDMLVIKVIRIKIN